MKEYQSNGVIDTQNLAQKVAQLTYPGLIITLNGDLGAGKTTFTKALAQELGVKARVKSPTFNILNIYQGQDFPIYHFDAYRLEESGALDQGFEDYIGTDGLTLIEWPQYMADLLPNDYLSLNFIRQAGDNQRLIQITGQGTVNQLVGQLA